MTDAPAGYAWGSEKPSYAHGYLWPALQEILRSENGRSVFDLGCGNGGTASLLTSIGYDVVGVDPSTEGICHANRAYPTLRLEKGSGYDDLRSRYGQFPIVISLEVVEHVYDPRTFAKTLFDLVAPGGLAIVSTPYHGYLKNIALAVSGKMDSHFTALWDHGHIKFWSVRTLEALLREAGFASVAFRRVGRLPPLAKSMIATARKA